MPFGCNGDTVSLVDEDVIDTSVESDDIGIDVSGSASDDTAPLDDDDVVVVDVELVTTASFLEMDDDLDIPVTVVVDVRE